MYLAMSGEISNPLDIINPSRNNIKCFFDKYSKIIFWCMLRTQQDLDLVHAIGEEG